MKYLKLMREILALPFIFFLLGSILLASSYFEKYFSFTSNWHSLINIAHTIGFIIIILSIPLLLYKITVFILFEYQKLFIQKGYRVASLVFSIIRHIIKIIFVIIAIQICIWFIDLPQNYLNIANKIVYAALIISAGWILLQILKGVETIFYQYTTISTGSELKRNKATYTKIHIIKNVAVIITTIFIIAAILMLFENVRQLGISLLASAGLFTAIAGLASQKALSSISSGIQLALAQPIKIDDAVIIDNEFGNIEEINLTYVVVRLWDLRRMVVPISYFLNQPFQNWTHSEESMIGSIFLYVDYSLPVQPLREILEKMVEAEPLWNKSICLLHVTEFKETTMELRILVSAANPGDLFNLRASIREKLLEFIRENYPHCFPQYRLNSSQVFQKQG